MKRIPNLLGAGLTALTLLLLQTLTATTVFAAEVPCGTVTAYMAPISTAPGSITIGGSTFVLAVGATTVGLPASTTPLPASIGSAVCINGPRNASGAFTAFSFSPLNAGICGAVSGYVSASASTPGSITLTNGTTAPSTLPIAPGVTFTPAQVTGNQCFALGVDAQGAGRVTGYSGPQVGAPSAPTGAPNGLPNTSTASTSDAWTAIVALLITLTLLLTVRLAPRALR